MARFTPHTDREIKDMLSGIGVDSIERLFDEIPASLRAKSFNLPPGVPEREAARIVVGLATRNRIDRVSFLGGGYYDHYIPAAVDAVSSRAEFYTAYTPYQPEASQGTLQAIFEYQTMIASLTGLDYANASLYDGGTALYEAIAMAVRSTNRRRIVIDAGVNPLYRRIASTYCINLDVAIEESELDDVRADQVRIASLCDGDTAAIVVQNPNFFGTVDDFTDLFAEARSRGIVTIIVFYPISLGVLKSPGEMNADIAVGEGQSLGLPLSFGGPYLGLMAVEKKMVRRMPGRIVGETVDREGRRAFVLTLQAREQHIRREKATSNICSNQALCALRATVFLALLGKKGFRDTALLNMERSAMLRNLMAGIKGVRVKSVPTFNEFTVELTIPAPDFVARMRERGFDAGIPASIFYPGRERELILCATEKRTEEEIRSFAAAAAEVLT